MAQLLEDLQGLKAGGNRITASKADAGKICPVCNWVVYTTQHIMIGLNGEIIHARKCRLIYMGALMLCYKLTPIDLLGLSGWSASSVFRAQRIAREIIGYR